MIAKIWQKLGLIVLIIACLFNIVTKIVTKISLQDELSATAEYYRAQGEQKK
jgi:hypothetical protein